MTDDWQQVIVGGLGRAVFGQERLQVQAFEREGDVGAYLGGEHQFMSEALQVDAKDLKKRNTKRSVILEISKEKKIVTWGTWVVCNTSGRLCILQNFTPFRNLGGTKQNAINYTSRHFISLFWFVWITLLVQILAESELITHFLHFSQLYMLSPRDSNKSSYWDINPNVCAGRRHLHPLAHPSVHLWQRKLRDNLVA